RRPPRSPLFPYTTLFRSALKRLGARARRDLGEEIATDDLVAIEAREARLVEVVAKDDALLVERDDAERERVELGVRAIVDGGGRSEEHTSELQSRSDLVC